MARGLIAWAGGVVVACTIIAVVYIAPSGYTPSPVQPNGLPTAWIEPVTAERAHARVLAAEWMAVEQEIHFAEARRQLEPELARRRERDLPSVALVLEGPDSVLRVARPRFEALLDSVWRDLGLGSTKIAVGVVADLWPRGTPGTEGTPLASGRIQHRDDYFLPDSTDRSTCLAFLTLPFYLRPPGYPPARLRTDLRAALGPCAWYARFGTPGARVRHWLGARNHDLAFDPGGDGARTGYWLMDWLRDPNGWNWGTVYGFTPRTVGCLGSRPAACAAAVREGDGGGVRRRLLVPDNPWDVRNLRLLGADHYLADVLRAVGDDRFLEFWNTTLPIDTALTIALKAPVGEWTAEWQRNIIPTIPLTPAVRVNEWLPGLLLVALALGLVAILVRRREVR